ncbi:T-cell receptor beta chain [Arapaima gigas]
MAKLSFTAILFWLPGWSLSSKVVQGPPAHLSRPEASVEFNCSHSISNYDTILWYQKLPGGIALTLIGFIYYQTKEVEVGYQDRFDLKGNGEKAVSLHISNMTAGDTAVYLCAASYTVLQKPWDLDKNSLCETAVKPPTPNCFPRHCSPSCNFI